MTCIKILVDSHEEDLPLANCHSSWLLIGHQLETLGGARGVMVIVAGYGHGDTSSNPGLIAFHIALIPMGKVWIQIFSLWVNSRAD